jgi:hypothetical protein
MITLVTLLLWLGSVEGTASTLGYTLENYDQSPRIYHENKGQINLYNTESQVVVYVDLKGISSQSDDIQQYIKHINKLSRNSSPKLDRLLPLPRNC